MTFLFRRITEKSKYWYVLFEVVLPNPTKYLKKGISVYYDDILDLPLYVFARQERVNEVIDILESRKIFIINQCT